MTSSSDMKYLTTSYKPDDCCSRVIRCILVLDSYALIMS